MRTPKLVLLPDQKTFDIVVENGRWVTLDSSVPEQREQMVDQRIAKSLIDRPSRWDTDYGVGLWGFIGKKALFPKILERLSALLRWCRRNARYTGNTTITEIGATLSGEDLLMSVRTTEGNVEKYTVKGVTK